MCRSIRRLRGPEGIAERRRDSRGLPPVRAQGERLPRTLRRNEEAFEEAIEQVAEATRRLLDSVSRPR